MTKLQAMRRLRFLCYWYSQPAVVASDKVARDRAWRAWLANLETSGGVLSASSAATGLLEGRAGHWGDGDWEMTLWNQNTTSLALAQGYKAQRLR